MCSSHFCVVLLLTCFHDTFLKKIKKNTEVRELVAWGHSPRVSGPFCVAAAVTMTALEPPPHWLVQYFSVSLSSTLLFLHFFSQHFLINQLKDE